MKATDWSGSPPQSKQHAEEVLVKAALACAKRYGITKINIKRVAEEAGVTRQTVYRYFPTSDVLIAAAAYHVVGGMLEKLSAHIAGQKNFADKVIECVVFLVEAIPGDPYMKQYFSANAFAGTSLTDVMNDIPLNYSYEYLAQLYSTKPLSQDEEIWLRKLSKHLLRTILGLLIAPDVSSSGSKNLRVYLDDWLRPLLTR